MLCENSAQHANKTLWQSTVIRAIRFITDHSVTVVYEPKRNYPNNNLDGRVQAMRKNVCAIGADLDQNTAVK